MSYQLHLERWGRNGPAILLIHGLGGSGRFWNEIAQLLHAEFRVFAPDLLGFGRSPWPDIAYTVKEHLDALDTTLMKAGLGRERFIVAGHSLGATLAVAWAARHPNQVVGLTLMATPCYSSPQEARSHLGALGPLGYAVVARPTLGGAICRLICLGRPFWRLVVPLLLRQVPAHIARDGLLHTWSSYSRTLRQCVLDINVQGLARQARTLGLPTQLLHGSADQEAPMSNITRLGVSVGWPLTLLEGASHLLPLEHPRLVARAISQQAAVLDERMAG